MSLESDPSIEKIMGLDDLDLSFRKNAVPDGIRQEAARLYTLLFKSDRKKGVESYDLFENRSRHHAFTRGRDALDYLIEHGFALKTKCSTYIWKVPSSPS